MMNGRKQRTPNTGFLILQSATIADIWTVDCVQVCVRRQQIFSCNNRPNLNLQKNINVLHYSYTKQCHTPAAPDGGLNWNLNTQKTKCSKTIRQAQLWGFIPKDFLPLQTCRASPLIPDFIFFGNIFFCVGTLHQNKHLKKSCLLQLPSLTRQTWF